LNIALVGRMYAGKTTMANALMPFGYKRVLMAGPLKKLGEIAYGEEPRKDKMYETTDLDTGLVTMKSGRQILQGIGQSIKVVDRDIWLKIFINDTNQMGFDKYVVDDVRFGFEADYLRDQGWAIVLIDTPEETRIDRAIALTGRAPTREELDHESEREVGDIAFDYLLKGDMPIEAVPNQAAFLADL
jgi:dephospho-CoA kinase